MNEPFLSSSTMRPCMIPAVTGLILVTAIENSQVKNISEAIR